MVASSDPSAWRNFRKTRTLTRPVGRPRKYEKINMFYSYPSELIAEWCCVARSTAYAYKAGSLKPSKPAAKLFRLHRDRIVLIPEWRGWFVTVSPTMRAAHGRCSSNGLSASHNVTLGAPLRNTQAKVASRAVPGVTV